jgi:hypothetical protein
LRSITLSSIVSTPASPAGLRGTLAQEAPKEELTVVFMAQAPGPIPVHYRQLLKSMVLQALE